MTATFPRETVTGVTNDCPWCATSRLVWVEKLGEVVILCMGCGSHGPIHYSRSAAIARWNLRKASRTAVSKLNQGLGEGCV